MFIISSFLLCSGSKPSLKIRTASAIFWNYLDIFRDYGLKNIFFRNKTFFVFQDRKLKLSASVWKRILWNLTKFQLIQLIQQLLFPFFLSVVWLSWNCMRFHQFFFLTDAENFSFLSWKKVLFLKKIWSKR